MNGTLLRILKHGLPVAVVLGLLGWGFAEGAGMWLAGEATVRPVAEPSGSMPTPAEPSDDVAGELRSRIPFTMAAWGFGIVAAMELLLSLWRTDAPTVQKPPTQTQAETDKILNDLMLRAEAERRAVAGSDSPAGK
jgi:hypothetical protein